MTRNRVSVIIPNYNRAMFLAQTIGNILRQTYENIELIVVDDGSTDNSVEVVNSFGDKVTLIEQENQGPGAARNAGLRVATGEFVLFQDSDDLCSLNKVEKQVSALASSDAEIAFSPWLPMSIDDMGRVKPRGYLLQVGLPPEDFTLIEWWMRHWSVIFQAVLFRRSVLQKAGTYREDMRSCQDSEYFSRILLADPKVVYAGDCLTLYRIHDAGNITPHGQRISPDRALNWAKHLLLTQRQAHEAGISLSRGTRFLFSNRMYCAYQDLVLTDQNETTVARELRASIEGPQRLHKFANRALLFRNGLQSRVIGHRNSKAFCCKKIDSSVRDLITSMGLSCPEHLP